MTVPPGPVPTGALARAARILVIKLDELGDFILATRFLRVAAPQARIMLAVTAPVPAPAGGPADHSRPVAAMRRFGRCR